MINLYDILKAANGQLFGEPAANLFTDFSFDPQLAGEGQLFVALRSDRGDTHQYIPEAIRNGASGVLCVDPPTTEIEGTSVLMVRDTVSALMAWAKFTLTKLGAKVITVSGSSGKSATVDAITQVLQTRYDIHQGELYGDGRLNLAASLAKLKTQHDYVVLKLSTTFPGELQQMVEAVSPSLAIINQIDCVHPASFEDCQQYIEEHSALVEQLYEGSTLILNYDDDETREVAAHARDGVRVKTFGIDRFGADALAFNVKLGVERIGFDLRYEGQRYVGRWSPILGKDHLYGLLAALMVADQCGIPLEDALRTITELQPLPGHMAPLMGKNSSRIIDDSYRASHDSTLAALEWLDEVKGEGQRTFLVMGDMDDLGVNSQYGHRVIGQKAAQVADVIITQGAQAAQVGRAAIDQGKITTQIRATFSIRDTIAILESFNPTNDDIILIKGGSNAHMEQVVRALLADDADISKLVRRKDEPIQPSRSQTQSLRPSYVEVDATAIANNIRLLNRLIGYDVEMMATVKADAYGHGAALVARTALLNGAAYLAVASMAEAMDLRGAGIEAPILVLSYMPAETVRLAIQQHITATIYDLEQARMYDRAARYAAGELTYHVKVDTGMGRLGVFPDEVMQLFRYLQPMSNLRLEGIYTHFSSADDDPDYTAEQVETFRNIVRPLRASGFNFRYVHAANSPGVLDDKDNHFNMVRPGLLLYGLIPSLSLTVPEGLQAALAWKTAVIQVKDFPPGHPVGYGRTYRTSGYERIAILPIGYADGFRRTPKTWQYVLIHGQRAPVVGRVSMEKAAVNVTDIPDVTAGDEVVLLGTQGDEQISAERIAEWLGTINYEVVTNILSRVPRL